MLFAGMIHCGEKRCMARSHMCDGIEDCPWGQDERNCCKLLHYTIQYNSNTCCSSCLTNDMKQAILFRRSQDSFHANAIQFPKDDITTSNAYILFSQFIIIFTVLSEKKYDILYMSCILLFIGDKS